MKNTNFYNFKTGQVQPLPDQRDALAEWLFSRSFGQITNSLISLPIFSKLISKYLKSSLSKIKIEPFRKEFQIDDSEFESRKFESLNDYFIRKFKSNSRVFPKNNLEMGAPAEGYYLVSENSSFPVKGITTSIPGLISEEPKFEIKQMVLVRLSPKEYHHFHFPFAGRILEKKEISGRLYSINPITLQYDSKLYIKNKRVVLSLESGNKAKAYLVLVGATYVGSICLQKEVGDSFNQGDEAGYFEFGGSTAILLFDRKIKFDPNVLAYSQKGMESFIQLGAVIGTWN